MQFTVISTASLAQHGALYAAILRARYQTFIEGKKWDLPSVDGMEFDQYDTPASRWLAVHDEETIHASIRLTPTTAQLGVYSYMLRDAQKGTITGGIPAGILDEEAPVDPTVWEASRLFLNEATPAAQRLPIQLALSAGMIRTARDLGATHLISIGPANWTRWYPRMGVIGTGLGPVVDIGGDLCQAIGIDILKSPILARADEILARYAA